MTHTPTATGPGLEMRYRAVVILGLADQPRTKPMATFDLTRHPGGGWTIATDPDNAASSAPIDVWTVGRDDLADNVLSRLVYTVLWADQVRRMRMANLFDRTASPTDDRRGRSDHVIDNS